MKLLYFLILASCIGLLSAGIIIPDSQNPLIITLPHKGSESSTIVLNFQLAPGRSLSQNQFFALALPKIDGANTLAGTFQFEQSAKHSCALLRDGVTSIQVKSVVSTTGEEHIAYCQVVDLGLTGNMPLSAAVNYRLIYTLLAPTTQKPSAIFWRNLDLFTTTGQGPNALFIDSAIGYGQGAIYGDYKDSLNQVIKIEEVILKS